MNEFLQQNANTILIIIKVFLIAYGIFTSIGVSIRIVKHINEKGMKKSIGFIIYNVIGAIIFLAFLIAAFIFSDVLLSASGS